MKRILTLLFLSLCTFVSQAQITFRNADMPAVGWVNAQHKDTSTGVSVNFGNRGANQVYDFSAFQNNVLDTTFYLAPTPTQTGTVPNANLSVTNDHNTYLLGQKATTFFAFDGLQTSVNGNVILTNYSQIDTYYKFNTVYGQNFRGTYSGSTVVPGSTLGLPFPVNNVRITNTTTYTDTVDGWGTVKTPVGTYNCLRQKRLENSTTVIEYNTVFSSTYTNYQTIVSHVNAYTYLTKETHGSVITFTYDSIGEPLTASWSTTPPTPTAKFGYTLATAGAVAFHDSSTGTPLTYSWNFGDGSATSASQNPNHTYTANGTYYVCLTTTNVSGTDMYCDSVHITNIIAAAIPPSAGNDTASMVQPGSVTINVLANDVNHNPGDTLCVTTVIGAPTGWVTQQGCGGLVFNPTNNNFTGLDTFYYKVCDIHIVTLCDTAMVVVNVKAALLPPTANDDTTSVIQPGTVVIPVTANDINHNNGTNLCITAIWGAPTGWTTQSGCNNIVFHALDSNFMGLDTFYYKICDQQQTTLCDTAMVVVNVTVQVAIQPVADFSVQVIGCNQILTNTSIGADSIWWRFTGPVQNGTFDTIISGHDTIDDTQLHYGHGYRVCLTAINQSGTAQKCDTIGSCLLSINDISSSEFRIYPNPASDMIQLDLSHIDQATMADISAIEVYDILGSKLKTLAPGNATTINVRDLSNGVYLIGLLDRHNTRRVLGKFEIVK